MRRTSRQVGLTAMAIAAAVLCFAASAAAEQWRNISPEIGSRRKVVFDPADPSALYIGTPGGLYKSTDAGLSWRLLTGLPTQFVHDVVAPAHPARMARPGGWLLWTLLVDDIDADGRSDVLLLDPNLSNVYFAARTMPTLNLYYTTGLLR